MTMTGNADDRERVAAEGRARMDAARAAAEQAARLPDPSRSLPGKVGRDHPETARRAADLVAPRAGSQRARAIGVLLAYHQSSEGRRRPGMTAAEVADQIGVSRNQTATRLMELREDGWVEYVTATRFGDGVPTEWATGPETSGRLQVLTRTALLRLREERNH